MWLKLKIEPPRCTAQHKGERVVGGRWVQHYEKAPQKRARAAYMAAIRAAMAGQERDYPIRRADGTLRPLGVSIGFRFRAPRKGDVKRPKTTRPDLDNMAKMLLDCLTEAGLLADDAQVATLYLSKTYEAEPCVMVHIATREGMELWEELTTADY